MTKAFDTSEADRRESQSLATDQGHVAADPSVTSAEALGTSLATFLRRAGTILQAEQAVIMLYEADTGDLAAQRPALNISDADVAMLRLRAGDGVSGTVFREGKPLLIGDCSTDPRCRAEGWDRLGVRNSLSVPMVIERRNADQQVVESQPIGVVHVFNKRSGLYFASEEISVLTVLSRNAAAIIASARAAHSVADEKQKLELTLRCMPSGLLVLARNGTIQLINTIASRLLALRAGEGVGDDFRAVVRHEGIREFLTDALGLNGSQAREFAIDDLFIQAQVDVVRDERGQPTGLLCGFNDVTELRNVERMKTDFVSTVSHELRTPLTAIKGFIRTLLDDPTGVYYDQDTRMEFYGIIDSECDRLIRLINDLLNVSRIERGLPLHLNYQPVDAAALVEQCLAFYRGYTDDHTLVAVYPPDLPPLQADRDKLDQMLANLIGNAIKYSPDGGEILVRITDEGELLRFAITDHGLGIPPEHHERVFERFHRVHGGDSQRVGGTGIGLFLVKNLVEAHGGTIGVDSTVGVGSTFHFTLPKQPPLHQMATP